MCNKCSISTNIMKKFWRSNNRIVGLTAMEKDAYEIPTELQTSWSPKGLPFSEQIAGIIIKRRFPRFPVKQISKQQNLWGFKVVFPKAKKELEALSLSANLPEAHVAMISPSKCGLGFSSLTAIHPSIPPNRKVRPTLMGINHLRREDRTKWVGYARHRTSIKGRT